MSPPIIAFFNNKGGVGKTSLVYHLAWMYFGLGLKVVAADLDPQANLTAAFLDEDRLVDIWEGDNNLAPNTIFRCIKPLLSGIGDIADPTLERIEDGLSLLVGDLQLSSFEDELSSQWPDCLDRKERSFRVISAFWRILSRAASITDSDVVLVDLGPNLGAINRAALIASDYVVVPLSPDLFSLQGLKNLGPTVRRWRQEWQERIPKNPASDLALPNGQMQPVGYIILQHGVRFDRPVKAFQRWIEKIPETYREKVIGESIDDSKDNSITDKQTKIQDLPEGETIASATPRIDPHRLALLKHYQGLMPMAEDCRKPMFHLKPADGAIGAHSAAVRGVYNDFKTLAQEVAKRTQLILPDLGFSTALVNGNLEPNLVQVK